MRTEQTIDLQMAQQALEAMSKACLAKKQAVVLAVVDHYGELTGLLRLDGAPLSSIKAAANKAYTAARECRSTKELSAFSRDPVHGFEVTNWQDNRVTVWGGGVPILINGDCVGGIGVSGLTMDEDEVIARIGLAAIGAA